MDSISVKQLVSILAAIAVVMFAVGFGSRVMKTAQHSGSSYTRNSNDLQLQKGHRFQRTRHRKAGTKLNQLNASSKKLEKLEKRQVYTEADLTGILQKLEKGEVDSFWILSVAYHCKSHEEYKMLVPKTDGAKIVYDPDDPDDVMPVTSNEVVMLVPDSGSGEWGFPKAREFVMKYYSTSKVASCALGRLSWYFTFKDIDAQLGRSSFVAQQPSQEPTAKATEDSPQESESPQ